ncbi:hypothetical protein NU195Hw_Modified_171t1 [Hortaea werneckii]
MARVASQQNGVHINGEVPPPSTLAAQIVQNQARPSNTQQPAQNGDGNTLSGLLHEMLHNPAAAQETNVSVNVQLVNVVAEAGLGPLASEDPFAQLDHLLAQARDSIAVIEKTVNRQPEVLFTPISNDGPQLLLPLLTRLVAICGRPQCSDMPAATFLDGLIRVLIASTEIWQQARLLQQICQDIVDETLTVLEAQADSPSGLAIMLPSAKCIARLWPNSQTSITLPAGCQTNVSKKSHAFMLAVSLTALPALDQSSRNENAIRLCRALQHLRKDLEQSHQWEEAISRLLDISSMAPVLQCLVPHVAKAQLSNGQQQRLASALLRQLRKSNHMAAETLTSSLRHLAETDEFVHLHEDLKVAVTTWLHRYVADHELPEQARVVLEALRQGNVMTDEDFQTAFADLDESHASAQKNGPRRIKRRKLATAGEKSSSMISKARLASLLTGVESDDLTHLAELAPSMFQSLNDEDRSSAFHLLAAAATEHPISVVRTIAKLLELPELGEAKRLRILAMLAARKCVLGLSDSTHLDLAQTPVGRFCLGSLHSSVRELRIAAGQTLPCFLREDLPDSLKASNRHTALEYLRMISDRDIASEHETLISAWGGVALVCGDRELNLVLMRLVDYLGHSNGLICSVAAIEIEKITTAKGVSIEELFRPFWSTVAVSVVQDLHTRPQKAQQLCDILHTNINQFLVLTQRYTVPTLVLTKKKDLLQRIAAARSSSVKDLCLQPPTNRAATIALLLTQSTADVEEAAMECLSHVCPDFQGEDISVLIRPDPALVGCEMLKLAGDAPDERKSRLHHAVKLFTTLALRKPGSSKTHAKANRTLIEYFDEQILGILTHYSQQIESAQQAEPIAERLRALRAIREMIHLIKAHAGVALPQIRACLQSAMETPELCGTAFSAWLDLVGVLNADDMVQILGQSFALVLEYWPLFPQDLQNTTAHRIGDLVKTHNKVMQENVLMLPSLSSIPALCKLGGEIDRLRKNEPVEAHFKAFRRRLEDESRSVVRQTLKELCAYLADHQEFVHDAALSEQPAPALTAMLRSLLDATTKYSSNDAEIAELCGKALGIVGCVDPNWIEAPRVDRKVLLLSNFERASEVIDWTVAFLEDVLIRTFKATTNARSQGFLAYTIQELLKFCGVAEVAGGKTRSSQSPVIKQKWDAMPEHVRITLTPFMTSRYHVFTNNAVKPPDRKYPGFSFDTSFGTWLRTLVYDLLWRAKGDNAQMAFPLIARIIRSSDLAIAHFMLPYAMLNVVLGGTVSEVQGLVDEFLAILLCQPADVAQLELAKQSSETVFGVLDYMANWLQEKKRVLSQTRADAYRTGHSPGDFNEVKDMGQIEELERFLSKMPAEALATRAMECGAHARALFNWEQHIRQKRRIIPSPLMSKRDESLYEKLQDIYASIDEPDGLEGIGAHLSILSEEQQVVQHTKSGRWTAAQAWYEMELAKNPGDDNTQLRLLDCLRETGQYAPLLRYAQNFLQQEQAAKLPSASDKILSLALEGQWMTADLQGLKLQLEGMEDSNPTSKFNLGLSNLLIATADGGDDSFSSQLSTLRTAIVGTMTTSGTNTLQACHPELGKLHALYEIEALNSKGQEDISRFVEASPKRLDALGSYMTDKQYLLGLRRAAMSARRDKFEQSDIGSNWLNAARLARKAGNTHSAYNAVLQAYACGEKGAKLEEARLLWSDGHQRQAIQALETAIKNSVFDGAEDMDVNSESSAGMQKQNMLSARAHLLLAKWLDASGQSQSKDMTARYQHAARTFQRWEKGHYYLGKHYNKLLEAEKAQPENKQSVSYASGEIAKSVIENMIRSIPFGNKFWHQTIPRILTLWLDLGMKTLKRDRGEDQAIFDRRVKALNQVNKQLQKYFERIPPYVFYTALPQMISRITHPNPDVWRTLSGILFRIVAAHPSQALWGLLAVIRASDRTRADRGMEVLSRLKDPKLKPRSDGTNLLPLINSGQKLSDGLLLACEQHIEPRKQHVSLHKDLSFSHKLAPNNLVVPVEATLTPNLPAGANSDKIRRHQAFVNDKVTIQSFDDDVLVLSSLQRPRKIVVRGSDGKRYGLLCKPKDDLRKDQRLMEFNGIINRALKRDPESSKRRLYIKTYAVTPLSEESGTLEWVEGIKPTRDILLNLYGRKGIRPNYGDIRNILNEACSSPEYSHLFTERVQSQFPPSLWEWFTETYSEPETWFAARLRYARTAAVMSMTGHILGLGDRHGENILLEESTGGVFHVDFNCLFDKGLTFEKPEMVPFRLTPNMVDAMGPYGYEGPFRKSSELTLRLLRQNRDTLLTVLETFLYDPTTDFTQTKKRRLITPGVPETPQEILDSVELKLKGLFRGENVPLGVEGYADVLIRQATDEFNLASMYIGWCAFL